MSQNSTVGSLVAVWKEARERGTPLTPEQVCSDAPHLLEPVRDAVRRLNDDPDETAARPRAADTTADSSASTADATATPPAVGGYRVLRLLGRGGMGCVYEADDPVLRRRVAVKVMRGELAADPIARERFLREARAQAAVQHDHVAVIHDVKQDADGTPFLVLPLLSGETLADRLARTGGPLAVPEGLRIGRQISEGLAAAHARGLVHRDVKPSNVWLDAAGGAVRVLDFGLARAVDGGSDPTVTPDGSAGPGTPAYMAPEQAAGRAVDGRADLFSLGAVLFEMATGRRAFPGRTVFEALREVAAFTPPSACSLNPEVPEPLSRLIADLLAKEPAARTPGTAAGAADVLRVLETDATATLTYHSSSPATTHRRWPMVAGGAGVAVLLAAVIIATRPWSAGGTTPTPAEPPDGGSLTTSAPVPLRVVNLTVHHFEKTGPDRAIDRGAVGESGITPKLGDQVTVEARLSRPAYAYLVAFAPDGRVHRLTDDQPAVKAEAVRYPAAVRREEDDVRYGLTDGVGLYVFAVVASDDPLPPFDRMSERARSVWAPGSASPSGVYRYDGEWVEPVAPPGGGLSGERGPGEKAIGPSGLVVKPAAALRDAVPGSQLFAVGFGVSGR